jgi:hypothetical protein
MALSKHNVSFVEVKQIIQAAFPGAKSRRPVGIEGRESYSVRDFWDGGSREECRFLRLEDLQAVGSEAFPQEARQQMGNPFNLPIGELKMQPGFCVVEHIWFCGKDLGYRIIVHPDNLIKLLP